MNNVNTASDFEEEVEVPTYKELIKDILSTSVRSVYQIQKLRIQAGNRIVANFRARYLGLHPNVDLKTDDEKDETKLYGLILGDLKFEFRRITDAIVQDYANTNKEVVTKDGELTTAAKKALDRSSTYEGSMLITHRAEYALVNSYIRTLRTEELLFNDIKKQVEEFPIYEEFLKNVRGCGPAMAGVIISYFDIHKAHYPSNMIAYCGIDVAMDGRGRGRYAEHLITREYTDREGKLQTRQSITYEPFLKTKMLGVLGTSFLRSGSPYRNSYDGYKHRIESRPVLEGEKPLSKLHIHRMAMRYMIKIFLIDLYRKWRELEGLPIAPTYEEAKLGMGKHHQGSVNQPRPEGGIDLLNNFDPEFNEDDPR